MDSTAKSSIVASQPKVTPERPLKQLPQILCSVFIFLYFLFFVYRVGVALFYPYPLEYGEGLVFYESGQLWRDGFNPTSLYPLNDLPPYRFANYSPLFFYLQALIMSLTGPTAILAGRLISVLASFFLGGLLYRVTRQIEIAPGQKAGPILALAAALTPYATAALYFWGVIAKTDLLAIALSLAGVSAIWKADLESRSWQAYAGAGLLCGLALLTKQSLVAAPATIVIWLGLRRQWQALMAFGFSLGGLVGGIALFFQIVTGGAFYTHLVPYNTQPFDGDYLRVNLQYFLQTHLLLLILALIWVARPLIWRKERFDLWSLYFLVAFAASFSVAKFGAAINYYIESLCIVALLAWWQLGKFIALRSTLRLKKISLKLSSLIFWLMVLQLLYLHHIPNLDERAFTPTGADFAQASQIATTLVELSRRGPILTEDSGWQAALGIQTDMDDPFTFGQAARQGVWDDRRFVANIQKGYYRSVLFEIYQEDRSEAELDKAVNNGTAQPYPERFAPNVLGVLLDRNKYVPYKRSGRWLFLVWKG